MSNAASAAMTVTVRHTPISWRRLGTRDRPGTPGTSRRRRAGADSYRAASILVMPVSSRTVQKPEQDPDPDDADRRQGGVEVAEPGPGDVAQADGGEDLVDEPGQARAGGPR